jgi:hypothetical protein
MQKDNTALTLIKFNIPKRPTYCSEEFRRLILNLNKPYHLSIFSEDEIIYQVSFTDLHFSQK